MRCLQLLLLWCFSSIPQLTGCISDGGFSCVTAYWNTVSCVLNATGDPVESNTTYSLEFNNFEGLVSCPLLRINHSYSCFCKILQEPGAIFSRRDTYAVALCHESVCHTAAKGFAPSQNIQPTPPHRPEVQETQTAVNVVWQSGYEEHRYFQKGLDYKLQLQTPESAGAKILDLISTNNSEVISKLKLTPGATYCVKVTSKPRGKDYTAIWSEWSPTTCWRNGERDEEGKDNKLFILIKSLGPVCLVVGVMLVVLNKPALRKKIKTLSHIPTPAPLFQHHGGDLKEWLQPQGRLVLTHKTEEMLTTDAVTVEPKPVTKDPEEQQVFFYPTAHLALAQCPASYVGLPGLHEATAPSAPACPGDLPYTRLHCSAWGVAAEEAEVVCALPGDVLDVSREDSGCGGGDRTPSPECSLPDSPVDDCPPPCVSVDYCILNKTAGGFVPVLLSRAGRLNVPSD
ncbi:uncharacterized protein AB9W97_016693 isoform 1-T2 [Spinachia spinachia]